VSAQENEALVRWFFEEAWGKGNLAAIDEYIAADYVEHTLPLGSQQGRDALRGSANRRVAYVSRNDGKAVKSL
jgi:hypothetical protein